MARSAVCLNVITHQHDKDVPSPVKSKLLKKSTALASPSRMYATRQWRAKKALNSFVLAKSPANGARKKLCDAHFAAINSKLRMWRARLIAVSTPNGERPQKRYLTLLPARALESSTNRQAPNV